MKLKTLLLIIGSIGLAACSSVNGQTPLERAAEAEERKEIDATIKQTSGPYKEFEGKGYYIGKKLYSMKGYIPKDPSYSNAVIADGIKILDATEEGCRVERTAWDEFYRDNPSIRRDTDHDFFVRGMKGFYSGRKYGTILIFKTGEIFSYGTAAGGSRSIPLFEWGKEITQAEYLKLVQPQMILVRSNSLPTSTKTNVAHVSHTNTPAARPNH